MKYFKKTMESFIKTLISLSEKCPEINIIVRPHPAENISKWHEIFDNHKKIRVVYDYQNTCCLDSGFSVHYINELSHINGVLLIRKAKY